MNQRNIKLFIKNIIPESLREGILSLTYMGKKMPDYAIYEAALKNKSGLEIGGPSYLFKTTLPIYQKIKNLDGVNFSTSTVWEGKLQDGGDFNYFQNKKGLQFISEASELSQIKSSTYDFILSSNCLEHLANPLKAIKEWHRIIKPGGHLLLILPKKDENFDHRRPVTKFEHLLEDYRNQMTEHDLTHLEEILEMHDLAKDPAAGNLEEFRNRSLDNFNNRCLHHHIFDMQLIEKILEHFNLKIIQQTTTNSDYLSLSMKNLARVFD